jgi:hypothetical protein
MIKSHIVLNYLIVSKNIMIPKMSNFRRDFSVAIKLIPNNKLRYCNPYQLG